MSSGTKAVALTTTTTLPMMNNKDDGNNEMMRMSMVIKDWSQNKYKINSIGTVHRKIHVQIWDREFPSSVSRSLQILLAILRHCLQGGQPPQTALPLKGQPWRGCHPSAAAKIVFLNQFHHITASPHVSPVDGGGRSGCGSWIRCGRGRAIQRCLPRLRLRNVSTDVEELVEQLVPNIAARHSVGLHSSKRGNAFERTFL